MSLFRCPIPLPSASNLRTFGVYSSGGLFALGIWFFLDAAIVSKHANASDVHVHINSLEKARLSAESFSFSGSNDAWKARLVLFLGFALMAGGLAGSVCVLVLKYVVPEYPFPTLYFGVANVIANSTVVLWVSQNFEDEYNYNLALNITWHAGLTYAERTAILRQPGLTIWLTGLSASGKSTIATALEQHLLHNAFSAYRLDGDNIRFGLNKDLGFSPEDRVENIRRIGEVAKLFADAATVAIASFISPYIADRKIARDLHDAAGLTFIEVHVDVPLEVAEQRDPKQLYQKARAGIIKNFTGVSPDAPYEKPEKPEIYIDTSRESVEDAVAKIVEYLESNGILKLPKDTTSS
ncbi:hypothetical protein H072_5020 [Dactylellina haptotyla CBS 200.50]|uniref:Adenylyl-sulfate kinase n=1 Tax=Dactylellina haptotyla (strain CBS 200.50) TaxID=1284197 RepID=S8BNL4_DACHA|nr:hypothetical protein H072_5020 [Dactylellina haptotyla CBS 200.50]